MEKDFESFVIARCENALKENEEYMRIELSGKLEPEELQSIAEEICYVQGFEDCKAMLLNKLRL